MCPRRQDQPYLFEDDFAAALWDIFIPKIVSKTLFRFHLPAVNGLTFCALQADRHPTLVFILAAFYLLAHQLACSSHELVPVESQTRNLGFSKISLISGSEWRRRRGQQRDIECAVFASLLGRSSRSTRVKLAWRSKKRKSPSRVTTHQAAPRSARFFY